MANCRGSPRWPPIFGMGAGKAFTPGIVANFLPRMAISSCWLISRSEAGVMRTKPIAVVTCRPLVPRPKKALIITSSCSAIMASTSASRLLEYSSPEPRGARTMTMKLPSSCPGENSLPISLRKKVEPKTSNQVIKITVQRKRRASPSNFV